MITLPSYSQLDSKWSQTKMQPSGYTLGEEGCLVTSAAMAFANFGINVTPDELCNKLNVAGGFDGTGMMNLKTMETIYSSIMELDREYTTLATFAPVSKVDIHEAINRITRLICLGIPVCLNVNKGTHWIVAWDLDGPNDFVITDASNGKSSNLSTAYDYADKSIVGYQAWIGAPISFPNPDKGGLPSDGVCAWKLSQCIKGINSYQYLREAFQNLTLP